MNTSSHARVNLACIFYQAGLWLGISALLLQLIYLPNAFYKMKWDTIISAHCASIPTEFWTRLAMETMIAVDFAVASLVPFHIMIFCNVELLMRLSIQKQKVGIQTYSQAEQKNIISV